MFGKEFKFKDQNQNILMKTKLEFNKLVKDARELKNMKNSKENEMNKKTSYIDLLKSNIDFIENEYKEMADFAEYTKAINILNNNISNFETKLDNLGTNY